MNVIPTNSMHRFIVARSESDTRGAIERAVARAFARQRDGWNYAFYPLEEFTFSISVANATEIDSKEAMDLFEECQKRYASEEYDENDYIEILVVSIVPRI